MAMKPLDPAPKQPLTDVWELVGLEAGRTDDGLKGTLHLWNGKAEAVKTLLLTDVEALARFADSITAKVSLDAGVITNTLLQLVVAMEAALRQREGQGAEKGPSQATRLVELALEAGVELFHTPDGEAYATVAGKGHRETWPLKEGFRHWLAHLFYQAEDKSPGSQAVQDALRVLEGQALYDGPEIPVWTRLAEHNGAIYLDLANASWQTVEVSDRRWRIVEASPVKFRRSNGGLCPVGLCGGASLQVDGAALFGCLRRGACGQSRVDP